MMSQMKIGRVFWVGFAFAAATTLSFVPEARACGHHERGHEGGHAKEFKKMKPAQFIERFDKNGDGVLSLSELPDLMRKRLAEADTNGDGKLSEEELRVRFESFEQKHGKRGERGKRFEKLDKNGDGVLTREEVGEKWEFIAKADANGDGKVTKEELEKGRASIRAAKKSAKKAAKKGR